MNMFLRVAVSISTVGLAAAHILLPSVTIDSVAVTLFAIALLPWLSSLLRHVQLPEGVKSIQLPGGLKIEGREVKNEIEKVITGHENIGSTGPYEGREKSAEVGLFASTDPNVALVGLRIEIERRVWQLAKAVGVEPDRRPLSQLVRELHGKGVLSPNAAEGLAQLVTLGNLAAGKLDALHTLGQLHQCSKLRAV